MTKTTTLCCLFLTLLLFSCKKKSPNDNTVYYRAVHGKDTAFLSLVFYKERFYGKYELLYGMRGKDSGVVRGQVYGDTLKGEYKYISYGGGKSISPIILLKSEGKLKLGKGIKATYMGIPFYVKDVPIDYNTGFIFEEVDNPSAEN